MQFPSQKSLEWGWGALFPSQEPFPHDNCKYWSCDQGRNLEVVGCIPLMPTQMKWQTRFIWYTNKIAGYAPDHRPAPSCPIVHAHACELVEIGNSKEVISYHFLFFKQIEKLPTVFSPLIININQFCVCTVQPKHTLCNVHWNILQGKDIYLPRPGHCSYTHSRILLPAIWYTEATQCVVYDNASIVNVSHAAVMQRYSTKS